MQYSAAYRILLTGQANTCDIHTILGCITLFNKNTNIIPVSIHMRTSYIYVPMEAIAQNILESILIKFGSFLFFQKSVSLIFRRDYCCILPNKPDIPKKLNARTNFAIKSE